jgi:hypothetical protein
MKLSLLLEPKYPKNCTEYDFILAFMLFLLRVCVLCLNLFAEYSEPMPLNFEKVAK